MTKPSHVLLGRLLCRRLSEEYGIMLDTEGFLLGNILPDIRISFLTRPHFLKNHRKSTVRRIGRILMYDRQTSAYFGRSYSMELGILCHYYADFLCFAHSGAYTGDLLDHVQYERDLHQYLEVRPPDAADAYVSEPSGEMTAGEIFEQFLDLHESYARMAPSFENDISQSLKACTEALVLLTSAVIAVPPAEARLLFSSDEYFAEVTV
jgi:hypothetical protein